MRVAAFGRTQWLYASIRAAAARGHQIVLIGTCPAAPEYQVTEEDFARLAQDLGCGYFCDTNLNRPEYIRMVQDSKAEIAISVNWLTLIDQRMLDQFEHGMINAHAGDLPRFRGNAVPNWAILVGEKKVVLSLHQMAAELDAGPILLQRNFPLTRDTYIQDVYRFLEQNIPEMFLEVLEGLANSSIIPRRQPSDPSVSLRCFPRLQRDGLIDWTLPAEEIARLVRASSRPFAGAYSFLSSEKIIVWQARPDKLPYRHLGVPGQVVQIRHKTGEVLVLTGDGVLAIEQAETREEGCRPAAEIVRSARVRFGMDITGELTVLSTRVKELEEKIRRLTKGRP